MTKPGGGVLRFCLVGDVLPAALDPYPCSWVIFPKIGSIVRDFSQKKGTHLLSFCRKTHQIFKISQGSPKNPGKFPTYLVKTVVEDNRKNICVCELIGSVRKHINIKIDWNYDPACMKYKTNCKL